MLTINGIKTTRITLKKGEVKLFTFIYNVDVQNAEFFFGIKNNKSDTNYAIAIEDSAFDKSEIAQKKVKCIIDTSNLEAGHIYFGEMKTSWNNGLVDKTEDIVIEVQEAVTP